MTRSSRMRTRTLLAVAVAAAVAAAAPMTAEAATTGDTATSTADTATRGPGHKIVHRIKPAAAARPSRNTLRYGGGIGGVGVTSGQPKVYLVFWGTQWGTQGTDAGGNLTFSSDTAGAAPYLQKLFKGLGTNSEGWSRVLTQYCDGAGVAKGATTCPATASFVGYPAAGSVLAGVWFDTTNAMPSSATDNQLANEAIRAAAHFGNTTAAAQRYVQYVILSAPGTHPGGFNTPTAGWCAWHDYNGDTTLVGGAAASPYGDLAFTNMPYVLDLGTSCGRNYVNAGAAGTLDGFSIVEGHEYAETVTDQFPAGGWTATSGQENADECSWIGTGGTGGAANIALATGSFAMQGSWSNLDNACRRVR